MIPCVGAVVTDGRGRLLLIRRGHAPGAGLWSLPGGRVEPGESDAAALAREMREETGLDVTVGRLLGPVRLSGGDDVYDVRDYLVRVTGGALTAGDDAAEARWVSVQDIDALPLTAGLAKTLRTWGVLPRIDREREGSGSVGPGDSGDLKAAAPASTAGGSAEKPAPLV